MLGLQIYKHHLEFILVRYKLNIMLIENTPILNEYDNLMSEFKEDNLSETFLQQVLYLVKNITDNKVKNCL